MPEVQSWDQLLPQMAAPKLSSWDELLPKSPEAATVRTPEQKVAQMAEEQGIKPDESKGETSSSEGFWPLVGRSFVQSAITAGQETAAGAAAAIPSALGGSTVQQQATQLPEPDAQDEVTRLSRIPITQDWTNPRMWGVKLAGALGSSMPAAGLGGAGALAGGAVAGPVGAVAGGAAGAGGGMALQTLVPAYRAAIARGLDHDAALDEALTQTGIAGGFGAAMGITGGVPLFGTTVKGALKRPISEALVKLGVAQPGLMVAQAQAQKAAGPGGWLTPDEALEGYITGAGVGAALHGAGAIVRPFSDKVKERWQGGLTPEGLRRGYEVTQEPTPDLPNLTSSSPMWPMGADFYDKVSDAIAKHPESQMKSEEWHGIMKDAHSSAENIELPFWLADDKGKVDKDRLLAYVETRGTWVQNDRDPSGMETLRVHEPTGKTTPFGMIRFRATRDRDGTPTLAINQLSVNSDRMRAMQADPMDVLAHVIAQQAVESHTDRITWGDHIVGLQDAMGRLAEMHGMGPVGRTRVAGWSSDSNYVNVSPVNAANIRQGTALFSRPPGTYLNDDPFGPGRKAISSFLDRAQARDRGNEWIKTPEGGQGMYLQLYREGAKRLINIGNLDFEKRGTGAFSHYLDHIEREAAARGLNGVRVDQIYNKRLIPFLQKRGYVPEADWMTHTPMSMRLDEAALREDRIGRAIRANPELRQVPYGMTNEQVQAMSHEEYTAMMQKGGAARSEAMATGPGPSGPPTRNPMGGPFPVADPRGALILPSQLRPAAKRIVKIIDELRKAMGMKVPIQLNIHDAIGPGSSLGQARKSPTGYHIDLYLSPHERTGAEGLFATAAHEFGHVVMWHFFDRSPIAIKNAITNAFDSWRRDAPPGQTMNQLGLRRNNAVDLHYGGHWYDPDYPVLSLTPERQRYWNGFEEWFAEQAARWATTSEKPMGMVDRFFHSLGNRIAKVIGAFRDKFTRAGAGRATAEEIENTGIQPVKEMKDWLDSLVKDAQPFAADIIAAAQLRSLRQNQTAINRGGAGGGAAVTAVPQTLSTAGGRGLISRIFGSSGPNPGMAAHADRFNKFYEWMIAMPQLAKLNPHIDGLQRYRELTSMFNTEISSMRGEAERTAKYWRALLPSQSDALAALLDDYGNMRYRTPAEVAAKTVRRPSQAEFTAMAQRHGVTDKGIDVFRRVVEDFDRMLNRYRGLLEQGAHEIEDPVESAKRLQDIAEQIDRMQKAPYMPWMRFGNYTLTVRDTAGKVVHFETFESQKVRDGAHGEAVTTFPGHDIRSGYLREDVAPLVGMPPGLLDKIGEKLGVSASQKAALDELRFEYMPAQSFAHRFQQKKNIPGYSTDFLRAYASYMFHGANYFTRAKYVDSLTGAIKQTREQSLGLEFGTKRDQIANYMSEHFDMMMDPKPDFANLRSMMFHWALGFSPAAATLNLSQTILGTYPYLASKFGNDARAIAAMLKASSRLSTFYTKMRLEGTTDPELKGISEAVREGLISETQANVLAATADGRVLLQGFGGNRAEKAFNLFSRASQFFFEMTEQTNRRVAFRAAWDLAMSDPGNPHVGAVVRENQILFDSLRLKGFTEQEARAYVTAKDAVESTQYVYAPYARPKFMTKVPLGKTLFIFKSFTQNTLFYLWNNPGAAARSLIILGAAGGLMGLPGMEDMNGIIRALAYHLFGKDFDLQDEVRKFVIDVLHGGGQVDRPGAIMGAEGIRPDILLHGLSRVGYGIPAVADLMGNIAGMGHIPMPVVDRHMNLSMGNILPIEPGVLGAPQVTGPGAGTQNVDSALARQTQRASGAAFGVGFSLYRALEASLQSGFEWKKWEQTMPTALRNASQAFRFYNEGKARNAQGAALVRFDPTEPEQMMEIMGQSIGYRPERLSAAWDRRTAEREAEAFWDVRKSYLMQAAWTAQQSGDKDVYQSTLDAIRKFNKDLPDEARGKAITADALRQSFVNRAKATSATESGVPRQRGNVPLARSVQRLYPEAPADAGRKYPPQGGALGKP